MDYIGVFGTFGRKTLAIMVICIGDGIRDSLINRKKPTVLKYPDDAIIFLFFSISSVKSARKQDGKIVVFSVRNRNRCTESLSYFRFRTLNFSVPVLILHHDYQLLYS